MGKYLKRGDIIELNTRDSVGREQKGRRPFLIISSGEFNKITGFVMVCPITSKHKNLLFEVPIEGKKIKGYVLSDQVKTIDWKVKKILPIDHIDSHAVNQVTYNISAVIGEN